MGRERMVSSFDAKETTKQHRQPCGDCPFRRDSIPGWLGSHDDPKWWMRVAHGEGRMECHARKAPNDGSWHCAGAAIFRANICKVPKDSSILALPGDTKKVFSWDNEFEAHHNKKEK